ncbi:cyclin-dependent kinase inhibitor 3 family protein [Vibrio sp.]|uniref:Phosphatase n=1 Tax=Vibrio viridaestus TaxID=2487322 RepID=A0A3N9U161_9VIBR|nr:cyclin-dependent kinase inhibitor 3 family protein [Vibrio viridaestus]MDC0611233.1 cyclin-dependent kinase inhibitor 3 family protein [Vibrio sp.]RQW61496.1 phosphatase [Vibrio viridaestus]
MTTTTCHPTWELDVEHSSLVLMPCPGTKGVSLDQALSELAEAKVTMIISAITHQEFAEKNLPDFSDHVKSHGMKWLHLPIEDDAVPDAEFEQAWTRYSNAILAELETGKVALHCMGGSGRTGLLAARVLLDKGWDLGQIIQQVQSLRPGAFTKPEQKAYIERIAQA